MKKTPEKIRNKIRNTLDIYFWCIESETWYTNYREEIIGKLIKDYDQYYSYNQQAQEEAVEFAIWCRKNLYDHIEITKETYSEYKSETK